jgi:protein SCO1
MRRIGVTGLMLAWSLTMAGAGDAEPWRAHDIGGLMPDLRFTLTDEAGRTVTASDYAGKVKLLYFGYTHCLDICPDTVAVLARALQQLGGKAEGARVLFVSIDPARDGPAALKDFAARFSSQVIGLTGTDDQLRALSRRYRVAYRAGDPDANGDYEVYHSSAVFAFDRAGRIRLLFDRTEGASAIADDLGRLLSEP